MPEFSSFAAVMLEGRTYAMQMAADHEERYELPPTSISKSQNMRSSVIAQMASGLTDFELEPDYTQFGRIGFVWPDSGAHYLLKSKSSLPWVTAFPFNGDETVDVADDVVFLVSFEFVGPDLLLEVAPARRLVGMPGQHYEMLGTFESLGRYSPDTIGAADEPFNQNDDDAGGRWWEKGVGEDEGDFGTDS